MIVVTAADKLPSSILTVVPGLLFLLLVTQFRQAASLTYTTGEYVKVTSANNGTLTSPNYPNAYPDYANSIWLLEAPDGFAVRLRIDPLAGQGGSDVGHVNISGCDDYLEVRDGNSQGDLHFYGCNTNNTVTVVSGNRWLWVKFYSDQNATNTGFSATFALNESNATPLTLSPIADCQTPRWTCRNRECVSWAYRCDGVNDCGCVGYSCDEDECGGMNWTLEIRILVGSIVGTVIFILVFAGVGFLDLWLKKRQEQENQRLLELENSRGRRRPKAPALSMVVPSPAPTVDLGASGQKPTITTINENEDPVI